MSYLEVSISPYRLINLRCSPTHMVCLVCMCVCVCVLSRVRLFATLWTVAHQAPLSMGFSRQEYWSRLPCPPPGDLPDPGIKPASLYVSCIGRQVTQAGYLHLPLAPISYFHAIQNIPRISFLKLHSILGYRITITHLNPLLLDI